MSNNGFKVISESMVTRIEQDQPHATDVGVWFYLMMKCNYVTQTALSTFTDIGAVLDISDRQAANSCYKLRELGWVDFQVKRGSRKPTQFQVLTGWHNNSGSSKSSMKASSDDKVSGRHRNSFDETSMRVTSDDKAPKGTPKRHRNNFDETSMRLRCDFDETSMTDTPPGAPGSVPMPADADAVSADNTEHEERNMKQQRPRGNEGNVEYPDLEYPDDEDVVVSNFCYEENNSANLGRKENPYTAELCELFANSYGQSLPENKAHEWILEYGINRCKEVITKGNPDPDNPIGYMQKALEENWQFKDRNAKQSFGIATPSVSATRALIDDLKATWAAHQNPTAEEIAEVDVMLINAGLKDPPRGESGCTTAFKSACESLSCFYNHSESSVKTRRKS